MKPSVFITISVLLFGAAVATVLASKPYYMQSGPGYAELMPNVIASSLVVGFCIGGGCSLISAGIASANNRHRE